MSYSDNSISYSTERKRARRSVHVDSFDINVSECMGMTMPPRTLIGVGPCVDAAVDIIKRQLPLSGNRVAPLMISRLARGGKSTLLNEIFKRLKEDEKENMHCMIITSHNFIPRTGESQRNAILRLMASQLVSSLRQSEQEFYQESPDPIECDAVALDRHIGDAPFVLLIDNLNILSCANPVDADAVQLLTQLFLDKANRYLVYTTHYPLDLDSFRSNRTGLTQSASTADPADCLKTRGVLTVDLPEETDVEVLWMMDGCSQKISPAEVLLCGGIPSLIYSTKQFENETPEGRFNNTKPLDRDYDSRLLLAELISELVRGDYDRSRTSLRKFDKFSSIASADTDSGGGGEFKVKWPLIYVKCILQLCPGNPIKVELLKLIKCIEDEVRGDGSGKDCWEIAVQFALVLQCCYQQIHGRGFPFVFPETFPVISIRPLAVRTAAEARDAIFTCCRTFPWWIGASRPTLLFFLIPPNSPLPTFDAFVAYKDVMDGDFTVIGIQMKLDKELSAVNEEFTCWVDKGYVVRDNHDITCSCDESFWCVMGDAEIDELLGYSLSVVHSKRTEFIFK